MCHKDVDNYSHALEFVPECYKTQNMCGNTLDTYPSIIKFVSECYKTFNRCFLW